MAVARYYSPCSLDERFLCAARESGDVGGPRHGRRAAIVVCVPHIPLIIEADPDDPGCATIMADGTVAGRPGHHRHGRGRRTAAGRDARRHARELQPAAAAQPTRPGHPAAVSLPVPAGGRRTGRRRAGRPPGRTSPADGQPRSRLHGRVLAPSRWTVMDPS